MSSLGRWFAVGVALAVVGVISAGLLRTSEFERSFDQNLQHYEMAASMASRDPDLKEILLRRTEAAFERGGWRAANTELRISLVTEVEIYADDAHINALSRAGLDLMRRLQSRPASCKAYLLAGAEPDELPDAQPELTVLAFANRNAARDGFARRNGSSPIPEDDVAIAALLRDLDRGPAVGLTEAELQARAKYLDGDAALLCSAAIKQAQNMLAMDSHASATLGRIKMASTSDIDLIRVLNRLCREQGSDLDCPVRL